MNPVIVTDLRIGGRPLTEQESAHAADTLGDAWAELLARVPSLQARRDAGLLSDELVARVVRAMVVRVISNPLAIRQWSVDDASFTRDNLVSSGFLFVSEDEVALLAGTPVGPVPHLSGSIPYGRSW